MHFVASFIQPSSACISAYSLLWRQQSLKNNLTFSAISDGRGLGDVAYQNGGLTLLGKHCPTLVFWVFLLPPKLYLFATWADNMALMSRFAPDPGSASPRLPSFLRGTALAQPPGAVAQRAGMLPAPGGLGSWGRG